MRLNPERLIGAALAVGALAIVGVLAIAVLGSVFAGGDSPTPSASLAADVSPAPSPSATLEATPSGSATPSPSPSPTPAAPPLPTMLATIGDSYTQAWSVSPVYRQDHPQFSWAVGNAKGDSVFSLLERFQALGDKVTVVNAATSGKKMGDASRQASLITTEAAKLPPGATVFVTFELGTNDLCDDPMTPAPLFESQLRDAIQILRGGLPAGSRILMLSVPDFVHFSEIAQADAVARAALKLRANRGNCPPFLGAATTSTLAQSTQMLVDYDSILASVCSEVEARDGANGRLHCRSNQAQLSEKSFTIKDLSRVDYFHPSLSGQSKMAAAAWQAGYWAALPIPPGSAAVAPAPAANMSLPLFAALPLLPLAGRSRRAGRRPPLS